MVPMLMQLGISPDSTQAAYRVGDSSTNIITPVMPYFPLIVVFCQRYVKSSGIGTLLALMLPYAITLLVVWTPSCWASGRWGSRWGWTRATCIRLRAKSIGLSVRDLSPAQARRSHSRARLRNGEPQRVYRSLVLQCSSAPAV